MPNVQNQIQIVDIHEISETLAITRLQQRGYQINRALLFSIKDFMQPGFLALVTFALIPAVTPFAISWRERHCLCRLVCCSGL